MKNILLIIFITFSVSSYASPLQSSLPEVLIPLSVGNYWKYSEVGSNKTNVSKVSESQELNGTTWFRYTEFGNSFWVRNKGLTQIEPFYSMEPELNLDDGEVVILNALSKSTTTYDTHGMPVHYQPCKGQITVPAGTFECHRFEFTLDGGDKSISYYAINVGLIKNEYVTGGKTSTNVLVDYKVD